MKAAVELCSTHLVFMQVVSAKHNAKHTYKGVDAPGHHFTLRSSCGRAAFRPVLHPSRYTQARPRWLLEGVA